MTAQPLSTSASCRSNTSFPLPAFPGSPSLADGAGLAHDAGNLLSALGLYCDLLHRPGVLRAEHLHYAAELQSLSKRSGTLIRRLLDESTSKEPSGDASSAYASGRQSHELPYASCDAALVMRSLTTLLRNLAAPHARLVVRLQSHLPALPCAPETLERICVNLVRNAAQALAAVEPDDLDSLPSINVRLSRSGETIVLEVEDNGPGMKPAIAARLLHPLPLEQGAQRGLGHRIVHELATASGGSLSICVKPRRGTTIRIAWPATAFAEGTRTSC